MARIRAIKPGFFTNPDLYDAEKETGLPLRVAWAGLWCHADREGRMKWQPRRLKTGILPYDDVDFGAVMDALVAAKFLMRYEAGGEIYAAIPNWLKHQRPHHKEADSTFPPPPKGYSLHDPGFAQGEDGGGQVLAPGKASTDPLGSGVWGLGSGDGKETPPTPPARGGGSLRDFPDLVRRFLRGGRGPDGYAGFDGFFADRAGAHGNSAERACCAWLLEEGGEDAVTAAVVRGKLPARYAPHAGGAA